jgi:hypothetical protein
MQERLVEGAFLPASVSEQYVSEIKKGLRAASKRRDEASGRLHLYINISAAIFGVSPFLSFPFFSDLPLFSIEHWRTISRLLQHLASPEWICHEGVLYFSHLLGNHSLFRKSTLPSLCPSLFPP